MPHEPLHAHPFYDDRPLLGDGRLSLPLPTPTGFSRASPAEPPRKQKEPAFIPRTNPPRDNRVI